jgi:dGTPase
LADCGGFSHNRYALTIAEELEVRYQSFPGLNLTHEVLESQAARIDKHAAGVAPLLEAQVVDVADNVTYDAHDTDDSVKLGLVTLDELSEIPLIREVVRRVHQRFGALRGELLRKAIVHELIDCQVTDLLQTVGRALTQRRFESAEESRRSGYRMAASPELTEQKTELEAFLYQRVYRHWRLVEVRGRAQQWLRTMFQGYCRRPALLPPGFRARGEMAGIGRAVGEYLAGMTDRYCEQQYELHFAGTEGK